MIFNYKSSKSLKKSFIEGFSLVEMLIYMFILVLMLAVIMNIVISVINSGRIIRALRSIENSTLISLERITRETRQAENISALSSALGTHPGELVLQGTDSNGSPRTVRFYLSSGVLMFSENGIEVGALTQSDAFVSNLVFHHFSGANSEGIRTEITLESGTGTHYRSNNFYFSSTLR